MLNFDFNQLDSIHFHVLQKMSVFNYGLFIAVYGGTTAARIARAGPIKKPDQTKSAKTPIIPNPTRLPTVNAGFSRTAYRRVIMASTIPITAIIIVIKDSAANPVTVIARVI